MSSNSVEWYHGKIARKDAEDLIKNNGTGNGTFLVRESNTSPGDYVLSVLFNDEIIHYQIRKHREDAFFSIDEKNIIHGLDSLVEHYQQIGEDQTPYLCKAVIGQPPPHYTRRHGQTTLFHRATERSGFNVVKEMLNCGYPSIDAKNVDGQTAAHIASRKGDNEILKELIENGANINICDAAGCSPLHYACQSNFQSTVNLLIIEGNANMQIRNPQTHWVPLHEAASRGYCEIVSTLLALNAVPRPRTIDNLTPEDLAIENHHLECAKLLREYKQPAAKTNKELWYHGTLHRNEAQQLLKGQPDGSFLVRYSDRHSSHVLTMVYKQTYHYMIKRKDSLYFIDQGPYFESLEHIVEYYSTFADGLHTTLQFAIKPQPKPPLPTKFSTLSRVDRLTFGGSVIPSATDIATANESELKIEKNIASSKYDYIPKECLILGEIIGNGEFGSVYKGTYTALNKTSIAVAVKTLNDDENMDTDRDSFVREARVMSRLNHHCIVKLIGLCNEPCLMMIQEYVELGSMLNYLKNNATNLTLADFEFYVWAAQIACGMVYLESQQFVHRDLAARNILLASRNQAKISDFGLSRALESSDYYKALKGGKWPVRWYAPESYNYGTFSHASDVWSFGVMLWEMFTFGEQPFGELKGIEVIKLIDNGERLPQPVHCPDHIYDKMRQCWNVDPATRPLFCDLQEFFSSEPDYMNIRELINIEIN